MIMIIMIIMIMILKMISECRFIPEGEADFGRADTGDLGDMVDWEAPPQPN